MRLRALLACLMGIVPLVLLAGCSSSGDPSPTTGTSSVSPAATLGPEVPPATAVADPVPADQLPTATGAFGEKPTLTFPSTPPPPSLQRVILSEGTGPLTQSGDWLITNYVGQKWGGDVFDNSYDRGSPSPFQIGVGAVVPGWDVGLVGVPVGSRVMLSLPPADGYGAAGNSGINVTGDDTLVFVIDIVQAIGKDAGGQTDAAPQPAPATGAQVAGALGAAPTITIPPGTTEPTAPSITVLATGTGDPVQEGQVLVQYTAVAFTGEPGGNTWPNPPDPTTTTPGQGPEQLPVAATNPFAGLVGVPIGSRVLIQIPGQADQQTGQPGPALAAVVDLLYQTVVTPPATASSPVPTAPTGG